MSDIYTSSGWDPTQLSGLNDGLPTDKDIPKLGHGSYILQSISSLCLTLTSDTVDLEQKVGKLATVMTRLARFMDLVQAAEQREKETEN